MKVVLSDEDAFRRSQWAVGVNQISDRLRWIWPPSLVVDTIIFITVFSLPVSNVESDKVRERHQY